MDPVSIKLSLGAWVLTIPKHLYHNCKKIWNLYKRPKLKIDFKPHWIEVVWGEKETVSSIFIPAIIITPMEQELEIGIKSIKINDAFYSYLIGGFAALNEKKHNLEILNHLEQKKPYIKASRYSPLAIPLPTIGFSYNSYLLNPPKDQSLFFPSKKVTLTFESGNKTYHYGLDAIKVSKIVINHLSFKCEEAKKLKDEHKQFIL